MNTNGATSNKRMTPIEQRLFDRMADGKSHSTKELRGLMDDDPELVSKKALQFHICNLRKKLPPGEDIVVTWFDRKQGYRRVRKLASANDGRM